ncbi:DDE-type integrase/transposase/recombinase [Wolbachia pipientis]|uniref:DDE-type integrase/transposase/recombinase n=1 Tax=Wolbachia pipientis TaxID=955 RepID=A0A6C1U7Q0_WOLPI|nr:DDE-type integrase/transposase/recombinase [Wolbachia pipientis]TVS97841.1 DDE-type integrase/transposase/recombinase [Wolbachia pipientis]
MSSSINKQLVWPLISANPLLLHSDQGSQYTSQNYQILLNTKNIISSMSHKGCCYDNSVAEKFTQKGAAY